MNPFSDPTRDAIAQAAMRNNLINMSLQPQAARLAGRVGQSDALAPGAVPLDSGRTGSAPAPTYGGTPPLPGGGAGGPGMMQAPGDNSTPTPTSPPYRIPMFPPMAGGLPGGGGGSMTSSLGGGGGGGGFAGGGGGGAPGMSNYNPSAGLPQPGGGGGDIAAPVEQPVDPAGAAGATVGFSGGITAGDSSAGGGTGGGSK